MFKISRYFEVAFGDRDVSAEELRSFAEDHLGKLHGRAPYAAMDSATEAAFAPFDTALSARAEQIGAQMGRTITKDQALQLFRTKIRQRRGRVLDVFGEETAAYREIFPQGLSYYTKATMQIVKQRLDYVVGKFTKYQNELGAPLLAEFTALRTSFNTAREGQVDDKGAVSSARGTVRETRTALELQLMDNLLVLAREYKGQPEKAAEFFDQSKLEDPAQDGMVEPTVPPVM